MLNSWFNKATCHSCGNTIERGQLFCKTCGRSRGINQHFQLKLWELVVLLFVTLIIISLCCSGATLLISLSAHTPSIKPTSRPLNTPKATQTRLPTPSSTQKPTQVPTKKIIPTNTEAGLGKAKISNAVSEVNLRKSPGYTTKDDLVDVLTKIPTGATVRLLRGPENADGLKWWYIEWRGYKGWIAERTGSGRIILIFDQ